MTAARMNLGVVGTGSMGALHARVINSSERANLEVVVEPREEIGRPVADRFGVRWAADLDGLGKNVDAVIVAAATSAHHELALDVIKAGFPLLIEKPIADRLAATQEIIDASVAAGTPLMCGLLERYNGAVITALAATRDPVHVAATRHGPYAPRIKTGVAWDLLIHDVDVSLRVLGEPTRIEGRLGHFHPESLTEAEDVAECILGFSNGAMASVSASRIGQHKVRSISITELGREIDVDLLRQTVTIYRHVPSDAANDDGLGYRQQTIIDIPTLISTREPLAVQLDRFIDVQAGHVDLDVERASYLPAHRVVEGVVENSRAATPAVVG